MSSETKFIVNRVGIDLISVERIASLVDRCDRETLNLLFMSTEIDFCRSTSHPHLFYAICFAVKEAVGKALGTGLAGIDWTEIEANFAEEKLTINLHGKAKQRACQLEIATWLTTWTIWNNHVLVRVFAQ
jgi:holo-[acyl-carrier protein] synthase